MKVIKPIVFQESQLISTTATNVEANWSSGTTYALGDIRSYGGYRWQSLQASNTNHQPDTSPTWWLQIEADNKHAMFDQVVGTSTSATETLTVVVAPAALVDTIALINMDAVTAKITIRDGLAGPIVYEQLAGLSGTDVQDWYQYFFYDPLTKRTQVIFYDIPPYANAHITLELAGGTGTIVSIAQMVYGNLSVIGDTQYGVTSGIIDFSVKETDEFGNVTLVKRPFSKRINARVIVNNFNLNRVQNYLYSVRATPVVWLVSDDPTYEEALVAYGWYRDFSTEISYPSFSLVNIELESLT